MIFYHGTSRVNFESIKKEGFLWGRRFIVDNNGKRIKEIDRCTYLAVDKEEAKRYGDIILEVEYNPFNRVGNIKKDKNRRPLNNYINGCWQVRVYEPISIENIKVV